MRQEITFNSCDCHGFFSDGVNHSIKLFEAGKNREGWYTNAHLVDHFETEIMGLIKTLHPDCDIVIAFDNSMTHHAKVPNGLDVGNFTATACHQPQRCS